MNKEKSRKMRKTNGLHMNGGNAETSYANNSSLSQKAILMTKSIRERAITDICSKLSPKTICNADLGCSSGPNALLVSLDIVRAISSASHKLGQEHPEIQVFLNDLPGNDFNNLFKLLSQFQEDLKMEEKKGPGLGSCFYYSGVPGSFYNRLFPTESIHFVHTSYSIHWLSQVPEGVLKSNKCNVHVANTSPNNVVEAYYDQFYEDFTIFLKHRSLELVPGGRMVLTIIGRKSEDPREDNFLFYELLAEALSDMVFEGLIKEEKLHSFNIPNYMASSREVATLVKEEGSFIIDHLETFEIDWDYTNASGHPGASSIDEVGYSAMKALRSVLEPLLLDHFGEGVLDEMFTRFQKKITNCIASRPDKTKYFNIVVSVKKKNGLTNKTIG